MGSDAVARHVRVGYSFWGAARELDRTFPLMPTETQLAGGQVRVRTMGILDRMATLRLTDRRLCLVVHYAFKADEGFEFPRGSITRIEPGQRFARMAYRTDAGEKSLDILDDIGLVDALAKAWPNDAPPTVAT